jgi:hypothetical protein
VKVCTLLALYCNKSTEVMATLYTCNRIFLQRIKLLGLIHKMTKHGNEKERKKERKRKRKKKIRQFIGKAILFGS